MKQHGWKHAKEFCARNTRAGLPCPRPRLTWRWAPPAPPSCWGHLTDEEKQRWDAAKAAESERYQAHLATLAAREPACWMWDVPQRPQAASDLIYLRAFHQGRCAVCGSQHVVLRTDHDHASGLVRGLLCISCNTQEGFAKETSYGHGFAKYYQRPPSVILDIHVLYRTVR